MLYIKEKILRPITTGKFKGSLIYNDREIYTGNISITKIVRGAFNLPFKIRVYKINDNIFYHEETNRLFNEFEFNLFCEKMLSQIRRKI